MKRTILFAILLSLLHVIFAQNEKVSTILIKEAGIYIDLPNPAWKNTSRDENNGRIVYWFKREPITDGQDKQIIPNIGIIIEDIDDKTDVITYSIGKRGQTPFDVVGTFIHGDGEINFRNAVGYKGIYKDKASLSHTVFVIHAINRKKGIQIILDTTKDTFSKMEKEFLFVLRSIRK